MKKHRTKLSLRIETIRVLVDDLRLVAGGVDQTRTCPDTPFTYQTCRFCPSQVDELTCRCVTL